MNEDIKTLMFHRSYFEGVAWMNDSDRLKYYEAVMNYAFNGVLPEDLEPHVYGAFIQAQPSIDNSIQNHRNGKKGSAKRFHTTA